MVTGNMPVWAFYAVLGYVFLFMLIMATSYAWHISRRKERPPERFRLLRAPGESLRRRVQKADEDVSTYVFFGAFGPLILAGGFIWIASLLPKTLALWGIVGAGLVFGASLIGAGILIFRFLNRRRNYFLGYLGERTVAEYLEPLAAHGYRVFHDVPADGRRKNFNLDHVVVGPTGIAVVETKTRRKKKGRPGFEEHVVTYDGRSLIWPWGDDAYGVNQVQCEIDWLREWIEKRTGLRVPVKPILAIPGWFVKERAIGAVRVANQKILPNIIMQWNPQPLTAGQADLICRQLDERCRDVED
jgi:TRAP-type C4-dicarboxylate transport system permease small subunit